MRCHQLSCFPWILFVALGTPLAASSADEPKPTNVKRQDDYKSLIDKSLETAGPHGNLDATSRHFGILKAVDPQRQRVTLLVDGDKEPKQWSVRPGAELWCAGWWGRLDQFTVGDRVWIWLDTDSSKQPVSVALLCDELSEQDLYAPVQIKAMNISDPEGGTVTLESTRGKKPTVRTVKLSTAQVYRDNAQVPHDSLKVGELVHVQTTGEDARLILDSAAFEKRRSAQKAELAKRWANEGLPGTLIFSHPERREFELLLDHEAIHWGRSLKEGDKVALQAANSPAAEVRQLRPWRERTQILLRIDGSEPLALPVGQRVSLRLAAAPSAIDYGKLPTSLGKSNSKTERVEWLAASVYCPCMMHDECAGHFFTLAACNSGDKTPCGTAKSIRADVAEMIDKGHTDRQIFEELVKQRGTNLVRPHMSP